MYFIFTLDEQGALHFANFWCLHFANFQIANSISLSIQSANKETLLFANFIIQEFKLPNVTCFILPTLKAYLCKLSTSGAFKLPKKSTVGFISPTEICCCKMHSFPFPEQCNVPTASLHSANVQSSFCQRPVFILPTASLQSANCQSSFCQLLVFKVPTVSLQSTNC